MKRKLLTLINNFGDSHIRIFFGTRFFDLSRLFPTWDGVIKGLRQCLKFFFLFSSGIDYMHPDLKNNYVSRDKDFFYSP